ncbi:DNA breaking-rejoining enzyme [Roridomyces roridus]|uniref:DNA breaking-rejoining enzyme n=1 Tax=Roridomyces roridus TaxID=1738132 RepID=A0AAD7BDZ0_9AGAR|nr:DNA breaking-rejoining enzyme [Roridomyces roridus]
MRAAMTYAFGRIHGLGSLTWHKSEVNGRMVGNPSVSDTVAIYMTSLRRRKVRAGQTATSSRAITAASSAGHFYNDIIRDLYNYNHQPGVGDINSYTPGKRSAPKKDHEWAGGRARRLLQCTYVLAFLCLLRFDEVLKIQLEDIEFVSPICVKLTLPFRKTHQFGNVQPFYLYLFPEPLAYLCPVRALAEWLEVLEAAGVYDGYLFRKVGASDRISVDNEHMTSETFLEMFRNNLVDIRIFPAPYGTHSFRRGGCQWLYTTCRWGLRRICDWGGWSTDFSSMTIVKYLISYADDPQEKREDFMNPNRAPSVKCYTCGRSCHCI